jgi:tRNA(fMet)-specific endonuclease VapC
MKFLMDTDTLSVWQWDAMPDAAMLKLRMDDLVDGDLGVSVVTFHEQDNGCHARLNRAKTETDLIRGYAIFEKVLESLKRFPLVTFEEASAKVLSGLESMKLGVKPMDLRIASIALENDLTLVTRNTSDFARVPGLKIEDWTK